MWKSITRLVRGSQRGFTLIELLAVMAVIGVLAGIVTTSVSGTGETSNTAQAKSDGSSAESSAGTFFTDQTAAEVLTQKSVAVTAKIASSVTYDASGAITAVGYDNGATEAAVIQEKSSRWPEVYITENLASDATATACSASAYCHEFPTTGLHTDGLVISVRMLDSDGKVITRSKLLTTYTAVSFDQLIAGGYSVSSPNTEDQTAKVNVRTATTSKDIEVHNFLWLFRKSTSAGGSGENDARSIAVFKLVSVQVTERSSSTGNDTVNLDYDQIF